MSPEPVVPKPELFVGAITELSIDAIVYSSDNSREVHSVAGAEFTKHLLTLDACADGEARIVPGFRLRARHVILTAVPRCLGSGDSKNFENLANCYRACCRLAAAHKIRTLAFPELGTAGPGGHPKLQAARTARRALREFAENFDRLLYCARTESDAQHYRMLFDAP